MTSRTMAQTGLNAVLHVAWTLPDPSDANTEAFQLNEDSPIRFSQMFHSEPNANV